MRAVAVIPARLASTRLPRKPLLAETGLPMVVHVLRRASAARSLADAVVATDAEEIASVVRDGFVPF
jgi:3-deoxy-manno-octulosonate cytidylyltransferase (CMP-KDO synthetase)